MSVVEYKRPCIRAALVMRVSMLSMFVIFFGPSACGLSDRQNTDGSIVLSDVTLQNTEESHVLSASADINLPDSIRAGLDSGVSLVFTLDLKFIQPRSFWFDKSLTHFQQQFSLTYYELTRHYRVFDQSSERSRNYRSLTAALNGLGQFEQLAVPAPEGTKVHAALSFKLDTKSLPLPLQPLIASSWRLTSEEYQWPLN